MLEGRDVHAARVIDGVNIVIHRNETHPLFGDESMSIGNQKAMLSDYVKRQGWEVGDIYIDDGYSGTNFERPDFKRMIGDIENGKINMVVVKDLSRLGHPCLFT